MKLRTATKFLGVSLLMIGGCKCKAILEPANPILDPAPQEVSSSTDAADPHGDEQWATTKLGLPEVWGADPTGGRRIIVAVLSTGIDYNHEDLQANILRNLAEGEADDPYGKDGIDQDGNGYVDDYIGYDFIDEDGLPYDRYGLGTAAAGIIGAQHNNGKGIRGVSGEVSILPVRYLGADGSTYPHRLVLALQYALARNSDVIFVHLPKFETGPSWGSYEGPMVEAVFEKIAQRGIPVVVSAGNSGVDLANDGMAAILRRHRNVAVVTSVDEDGERPVIANFGMQVVHTAAPGERILSTMPGNEYEEVHGTFAAAAHVAGTLALAVNRHYGQYSAEQFVSALLNGEASDENSDLEFETIGGNELNIKKYLDHLN